MLVLMTVHKRFYPVFVNQPLKKEKKVVHWDLNPGQLLLGKSGTSRFYHFWQPSTFYGTYTTFNSAYKSSKISVL